MNLDSFSAYPELKQAVEDCYEAQDEQTVWIMRNHPDVTAPRVAVEVMYHLVLHLLWKGQADYAQNAIIRMDDARRARMAALSAAVTTNGIDSVPEMLEAKQTALQWGALPGVLADDIHVMLEMRLASTDEETRLTRLHNEAAAAAARVEDMLGENVVLFVYGAAQTHDRLARSRAAEVPAS